MELDVQCPCCKREFVIFESGNATESGQFFYYVKADEIKTASDSHRPRQVLEVYG